MSNRPEVDVERRRKAGKPIGRADSPTRRQEGDGGGGPIRPGMGGLNIPTKGKVGGCGSILLIILVIVFYVIFGGGGGEQETDGSVYESPTQAFQAEQNLPTSTPRPTRAPVVGETGQQWLVMLYQDADDQVLEQDIFVDMNEAERVGSTDRVTIVTQLDRYRGAYQGDGDWTSTRRYLVTEDDNLNRTGSQLADDLGEVDMADGSSLVDFVSWAVEEYPADRYVLVLSDHGMGWPGGWSDPAPSRTDGGSAPLISALDGDFLYLSEIDQALTEISKQTGVEKLDIIGLDACLMSQVEVYAALQPHAHIAIASEEVEPSLGWAYAGFLQALVDDPDMSPEQLSKNVVDSYVSQDLRIVDDQARQDFLRQGNPMGGFFGVSSVTADQLARQIERDGTLTAVDLDALPGLMSQLNNFAYILQSEDQSDIAAARNYTQAYTSVFGKQSAASYIDLGHFVQMSARQTNSNQVSQAANAVVEALDQAIIAEKHGPGKPGSTGVAIYFPNSSMYASAYTGPQSYNLLAARFVKSSLWDDFLAFHYNDRSFSADAVEAVSPSASTASRAPGAGTISLSGVTSSNDSFGVGESVKLSTNISGNNIGYVYLFIGLYDASSNSIYVADTDYLESPDTQELSGVYYPVWPDSESFKINFNWDGTLFSVSDGSTSSLALLNPISYGASAQEAVYALDGTYIFADTSEQKFAQLLFMDGRLIKIYGYEGADEGGAPAEITPTDGDTFTISQKWIELDASGNASQIVYEPGKTLTFRSQADITWEAIYAPAGDYLVGFMVSDLDGNTSQAYTQVTMR